MRDSPTQDALRHYLTRFGDGCMSYSTLQPELEYFVVEDKGYISYLSFRHPLLTWAGRKIVLSNPICAASDYAELASAFLEQYPRAIFLQVDTRFAQVLHDMGHEVNCFGTEIELPASNFQLKGKDRAKLRQWKNKCEREGVEVSNSRFSGMDHGEIQAVSKAWLKTKGGREYSFLTRPFVLEDELDARFFTARQKGKLIGFAVFDPIYRDGKVIGYFHNVDRILNDAPHGTSAYIILQALSVFEQEGVSHVSLGLLPLFKLREIYRHNKFVHNALWFTFHKLNFLYPFQGNASHKRKFAGHQKQVYMCSTQGNSLWELFITMKVLELL